MKIPWPPKWNKAIDSLDIQTLQWVKDHELSLLPPGTVFPRGGQVWETVRDCEADVVVVIDHRISLGAKAQLQMGERVRILPVDEPKPLMVAAQPVRSQLDANVVPEEIRRTPGYTHYWLSVKTAYLNKHFRLLKGVA